jgi:hypothetical protein
LEEELDKAIKKKGKKHGHCAAISHPGTENITSGLSDSSIL